MQLAGENEEGPSKVYRAFTLRDDDSTSSVTLLCARSVNEAVDQARRLVGDHPVELWGEGRMLGRFAPTGS